MWYLKNAKFCLILFSYNANAEDSLTQLKITLKIIESLIHNYASTLKSQKPGFNLKTLSCAHVIILCSQDLNRNTYIYMYICICIVFYTVYIPKWTHTHCMVQLYKHLYAEKLLCYKNIRYE